MSRLVGIVLLLPLTAALDATPAHWIYSEVPGEPSDAAAQSATWGAASSTCIDGLAQSPINIETSKVAPTNVLGDAISLPNLAGTFVPTHSGHAFQLTATPDGKPRTNQIGDLQYQFAQVHWHTPSENTIDGEHAVMEGHFVHQRPSGGATYLAVVAVLYDLSTQCNTDLDTFWSAFPMDTGPAKQPVNVSLGGMVVPLLTSGYYQWTGSLTTPPCTEGVQWYLIKQRQDVCQRQIDRLKLGLKQAQGGVDINNRVTQPLNNRVVAETPGGQFAPTTLFGALEGLIAFGLAAWSVLLYCKRTNAQHTTDSTVTPYVLHP